MKIKKIVGMRFLLCLGLLYAGLTVTSVPVYNLSSTNKLSSLAGGGPEMFLGLFSSKITPYTVNSSYKAKPIVPSVCVGSTFNFVNVGLTDLAHGSYLGFVFDNANMKIPSTVLSKGLNVLINMVPSGSQQQITVQLVDTSGNLYAQGTQTINQGLYLAEFGFNVNNSNAANPAGNPPSTALSDFPIASGTPVFFSTGPKMTPVLKPPYLNLTGKTELSTQGGSFNGTQSFVPVTGNPKATPVAAPMNVSSGLQFINVGLTDSANKAFLIYTFDPVFMKLLTKCYPYLLANGIYITISGIALPTKAKNKYEYVVTLQDSFGTVYASGVQEINQGLTAAEIAFNTMNFAQANGKTSTAIKNVPINGSPVVYKQQASKVPTTAAITLPPVPSGSLYNLSSIRNVSSVAGGGSEMSLIGSFSSNILPYTVSSSYKTKPIIPSVCVGSTFNFVNIGLTDLARSSFLVFTFDNANIQIPTKVLNSGMYILFNTVVSGSQQQIMIQLVDTSGKLYAQGMQTVNQGLYFAEIAFNINDSNGANPAGNPPSTAVIDFPIASGTPILFNTGSKMTPVLKPPFLNLTGKTELSTQGGSFKGTQSFVPVTGNPKATPVAAPMSVSSGLQFINVGLTDSANKAFLIYTFDPVFMKLLTKCYPYLLANGIYITISGIALPTKAKNKYEYVVTLQDSVGTVYASGVQEINQGLTAAEIAFNTMNFAQANGKTSTAIKNVPINGSPIVYKQQASTVQTTAAITLPPVPSGSKS